MDEWVECKISDIGTVVGGATPSTKKTENYEDGKIAWITPKDLSVFSGRYIGRGERNITETGLKSCSTQLMPQNTVLFSSRAPIGYIAIAANEVCTNQGFKSVIPNENIDPLFLYYLLKYNKDKIESMGSGTTFKEISGNTMKNIVVSVPISKEFQEKIASVLGSIDDKIEENERINNNLLEQLNELFSEFFNRSNWNQLSIGEVAEKVAMGPFGSNIKVSTFVETGVPIISGNHLRGYFLEEPSYNYITEEHASRLKNSIVYSRDIVFTHAGNIGQVAMIPTSCEYPYYVLSQRQFFLRCNSDIAVPEYVLLFFHSKQGQHELLSYANQTGVPSIAQPASNLKKICLPVPPIKEQKEWLLLVDPIIALYQNNYHETKRLCKLRDTLLPKLMSGEIDVSGIDL
ncbi:restriction endonuclease subunit S [Holdemania filiformis]|uniref:restriction endonuclease subunit S n=1 Tax=Holdemania filiformis TaxID=61171 RepID=UPI0026750657|nr:restriction endonuclease subunit S [Holdemania filiformis]